MLDPMDNVQITFKYDLGDTVMLDLHGTHNYTVTERLIDSSTQKAYYKISSPHLSTPHKYIYEYEQFLYPVHYRYREGAVLQDL